MINASCFSLKLRGVALRVALSVVLLVALALLQPLSAGAEGPAVPAYGVYAQARRGGLVAIPADVIFERCADAVFLIETFDSDGSTIRTGSGFFISDTGLALTNLHVLDYATEAEITLYNGEVYPLKGVHAKSEEANLAVISIDSDKGGWPYLTFADSDLIETGNTVYVVGSPLGYIGTMTAGIISTTSRVVDEQSLIQFTAPISFGSGGSPLLNTQGQVIGLTSSSYSYGQHLNLAVPVNPLREMPEGECVALSELGEYAELGEPAAPID